MSKTKQSAADRHPVSFEVYSLNGRLMGSYETRPEAERMLGVAFNAKYLIGVATNGDKICIHERAELH
jgi:hypothetical protein